MTRRTADQVRRIRAGTSEAMKRVAKARQCPKCGRKSAIKKVYSEDVSFVSKVCRWCDYEEGYYIR